MPLPYAANQQMSRLRLRTITHYRLLSDHMRIVRVHLKATNILKTMNTESMQ